MDRGYGPVHPSRQAERSRSLQGKRVQGVLPCGAAMYKLVGRGLAPAALWVGDHGRSRIAPTRSPYYPAIQQQKPLTPGEVAAKPTERVYPPPTLREEKGPTPVAVTASHCTRDTRLCSATAATPFCSLFPPPAAVANVPLRVCVFKARRRTIRLYCRGAQRAPFFTT